MKIEKKFKFINEQVKIMCSHIYKYKVKLIIMNKNIICNKI